MARGNIIQGQASGKLGDSVLMVRNGQQVSRVYTKSGARVGNQASEAARIQRVKFGSASNQWALYRYVCTRMFRKGRKNTQSDYNYFVKRNAHLLPYFTKQENADGVHVLMPGIMSEGNLGRIALLSLLTPTLSEGTDNYFVYDSNTAVETTVNWSHNMLYFKEQLKIAYPLARKVTYLFSYANAIEIKEEGETFMSQQITHDAVTIDLFKEVKTGENAETVANFFASLITSPMFKAIVGEQTRGILKTNCLFKLAASNATELAFLQNMGTLIFATDDNVSDCYSTMLTEQSVDPTTGVYTLWHSYRTSQSLRIAADSYGYQQGVMRDEVAAVGNSLSDAVAAYAARLAEVDEAASKAYLKSIGNVATVAPVQVRKKTSNVEDK